MGVTFGAHLLQHAQVCQHFSGSLLPYQDFYFIDDHRLSANRTAAIYRHFGQCFLNGFE